MGKKGVKPSKLKKKGDFKLPFGLQLPKSWLSSGGLVAIAVAVALWFGRSPLHYLQPEDKETLKEVSRGPRSRVRA